MADCPNRLSLTVFQTATHDYYYYGATFDINTVSFINCVSLKGNGGGIAFSSSMPPNTEDADIQISISNVSFNKCSCQKSGGALYFGIKPSNIIHPPYQFTPEPLPLYGQFEVQIYKSNFSDCISSEGGSIYANEREDDWYIIQGDLYVKKEESNDGLENELKQIEVQQQQKYSNEDEDESTHNFAWWLHLNFNRINIYNSWAIYGGAIYAGSRLRTDSYFISPDTSPYRSLLALYLFESQIILNNALMSGGGIFGNTREGVIGRDEDETSYYQQGYVSFIDSQIKQNECQYLGGGVYVGLGREKQQKNIEKKINIKMNEKLNLKEIKMNIEKNDDIPIRYIIFSDSSFVENKCYGEQLSLVGGGGISIYSAYEDDWQEIRKNQQINNDQKQQQQPVNFIPSEYGYLSDIDECEFYSNLGGAISAFGSETPILIRRSSFKSNVVQMHGGKSLVNIACKDARITVDYSNKFLNETMTTTALNLKEMNINAVLLYLK
ncbi:MAG: hypothetical protein EZS28_013987 [Streblomastix strix]|uniref:Uncharacterized protein n=1 Tax=Streblomastix strix TaxID=222440 RepID=A0A5J4W6M1_9EUKA|nr:MAG: hypothetical protein EZS28_013987 [Streblomastix strix]